MYEAQFTIREIKEPDEKIEYVTHLKVKFNFKKEIAPKDKDKIKEKCKIPRRGPPNYNFLKEYLENEGFENSLIDAIDTVRDNMFKKEIKQDNSSFYFKMQILPAYNKLGFKIEGSAEEKINNLEEIINLEDLNNFILTGKKD